MDIYIFKHGTHSYYIYLTLEDRVSGDVILTDLTALSIISMLTTFLFYNY